jgi:hypothetical protein
LLDGGGERVVHGLLGKIEVAEEPNQRGKDAARIGLVDGIHRITNATGVTLAHREIIVPGA